MNNPFLTSSQSEKFEIKNYVPFQPFFTNPQDTQPTTNKNSLVYEFTQAKNEEMKSEKDPHEE